MNSLSFAGLFYFLRFPPPLNFFRFLGRLYTCLTWPVYARGFYRSISHWFAFSSSSFFFSFSMPRTLYKPRRFFCLFLFEFFQRFFFFSSTKRKLDEAAQS